MSDIFHPGASVVGRMRLTTRAFPPYSYVPGSHPHPVSNPAGHSYGHSPDPPPPLDPEHWVESETYLYAIDLFNHGYYWEAHEAWESLWHAAGRQGQAANWLKGLIKLAAAAVKVREGNAEGVRRHSQRAAELLAMASPDGRPFAGVDVREIQIYFQTLGRPETTLNSDADQVLPQILPVENDP